jgi:hypothetical protein
MILSNDEVDKRLTSTSNLLNRLNILSNGGLAVKDTHKPIQPVPVSQDSHEPELVDQSDNLEPPSVEDLIDNARNKIALGLATETALDVLCSSTRELKTQLDMGAVEDPKLLSRIATDMSKIVVGIRNSEKSKNDGPSQQQVIIWKPIIQNESHYETIHVNE